MLSFAVMQFKKDAMPALLPHNCLTNKWDADAPLDGAFWHAVIVLWLLMHLLMLPLP